ncbi:MAG: PaaI family thioesterase, partial [Ginsengibacter sp.]
MDYQHRDFSKFGAGSFPGFVGVEVVAVEKSFAVVKMEIKNFHFVPNGYIHAGNIITLADTIAGYACLYTLPATGVSFTTIELKSNF